MDDLIKSMKAQLYDRATSPLLASFLFSWVIWNYRFVVVLSSGTLKTREKLGYIDQYLYPSWDVVLWQGMFAPLLSALVLIFVYPIPALWVFAYTRRQQLNVKKVQQEIEDETPMSQEEARKLRAEIWRAHASHDEAIREREQTIDRLKELLTQMSPTVMETEVANDTVKQAPLTNGSSEPTKQLTLDESQMALLAVIANSESIGESIIFNMSKLDKVQVKYYLDELERHKFIKTGYASGGRYYDATPVGRKWIVENGPTELMGNISEMMKKGKLYRM